MSGTAVITGLLSGLLFGVATPLSKAILSRLNSFQLAGLLYIGAALAFLPYLFAHLRREYQALRENGKKLHILGAALFGGLLGPVFLLIGLTTAHSMSVSIWLNMELVATAVLGVVIFKDHLDRFALLGVLLTLVAGIIVSFNEGAAGLVPAFWVLLACIFWGIDNHLTAIIDGVSAQTITLIKGLFGGGTNLAIGMLLAPAPLELSLAAPALLIGIFSYGISIVLYVTSAQNLGATRSQILFSTAPFWGILAAYLFLGEALSPSVVAAFLLLAGGVVLTNISSHTHVHLHEEMSHLHLHRHDDGHHHHRHPEEVDPRTRHSHLHHHSGGAHSHPHYPDLHHRHRHGTGEET
jgi:drug/metabolite transporter (DMT)-like permease